ncbi:hypothetical protein A3218_23465 [Pseudomonas chlororaphis]|uniref:hypothetical protein n=1 Tax=Pseudomonas chlororaphis TaxID=587753 RepID=UPI000789EBA4|nr:hypothetical protein [Pseudomonas chlororaphis]AMS17111.1 hypothetical protein A3218_23465 [Pseudomonas chlororaphis]
MKKIVPDPPVMADSFSSAKMDPAKFESAANKAINHYLFPTANDIPVPHTRPGKLFRVDPNLSTEEALSNACEILESAAKRHLSIHRRHACDQPQGGIGRRAVDRDGTGAGGGGVGEGGGEKL